MSQNMTVTPAQSGIVGAALGAGIGYIAAPPKYNLAQLIKQEPDIFERTFPKNLMDSLPKQKPSVDNIKDAQTAFRTALNEGKAKQVMTELLQKDSLQADYRAVKKIIPKSRANSAIIWAVLGGFIATVGKIAFGKES